VGSQYRVSRGISSAEEAKTFHVAAFAKAQCLDADLPFGCAAGNWGNAAFTGAEVYAQSCAMCHAKGVAGAPRVGEIDAWRARAEKGRADLLLSILRGKGGMPPKGATLPCLCMKPMRHLITCFQAV
jgi:cytochrome c5